MVLKIDENYIFVVKMRFKKNPYLIAQQKNL